MKELEASEEDINKVYELICRRASRFGKKPCWFSADNFIVEATYAVDSVPGAKRHIWLFASENGRFSPIEVPLLKIARFSEKKLIEVFLHYAAALKSVVISHGIETDDKTLVRAGDTFEKLVVQADLEIIR